MIVYKRIVATVDLIVHYNLIDISLFCVALWILLQHILVKIFDNAKDSEINNLFHVMRCE